MPHRHAALVVANGGYSFPVIVPRIMFALKGTRKFIR